MEEKHLLKDEKILKQSSNSAVTITNYRVRLQEGKSNKAHVVSIMLEKISSIELHYKSYILFLIVGVLLILAGLVYGGQMNNGLGIISAGGVLGGLFILAFFLTRKHIVSIKSDGGTSINFETKGIKREALMDFINIIEQGKLNKK